MKNWNRVAACLCALIAIGAGLTAQAHPGGLDTPSPDIPPIIVPGVYLSPNNVHALYSGPGIANRALDGRAPAVRGLASAIRESASRDPSFAMNTTNSIRHWKLW